MGFSVFFLRVLDFFISLKGKGFIFFFLIFSIFPAQAVKIQFPEEELASESVLPLIEPPQMVLNRNIPLKFRVELGLGMGFGLDEPFYFSYYPTGILTFNLTEVHALSLTGTYFFPKRSSSAHCLSHDATVLSGEKLEDCKKIKKFDPLHAPYPQMMAFLNYQYTPFYGKISLAKNWVMNLSIYGFVGPGLVVSNQNNQWPAGNFGIGQKLYINKWLGIRGDLGFYGYYGPTVAKLDMKGSQPIKYQDIKAQDKRPIINLVVNVGVIFLI